MKTFLQFIDEMNSAGSGAVAGIGINQDGSNYNSATAPNSFGEPGVSKKAQKKYTKKNTNPQLLRFIKRFSQGIK